MRMKMTIPLAAFLAGGCGPGDNAPATPAATPPAASTAQAALPRSPAPADASLHFVAPEDGAVVTSPFTVEFRVERMDVVPAGTDAPHSGHHHILVNTSLPDLDRPIPADENHIHFGDGSSSAELSLPPGEHRLQLLFADHLHIPHENPVYSEPITVTVQ